jgi:hypothetical protein
LPLSSEARADQGCRKRRNQVPDWSEITCRFPPKSPAAFDRNQVPVCSDFCIFARRALRHLNTAAEAYEHAKADHNFDRRSLRRVLGEVGRAQDAFLAKLGG